MPATGDAKFMEWQCTNAQKSGQQWWQRPAHCKQSTLENLSLSLGDLLSTSNQGNAGRVTQKGGVAPHDAGSLSELEQLRTTDQTSTAKPAQEDCVESELKVCINGRSGGSGNALV